VNLAYEIWTSSETQSCCRGILHSFQVEHKRNSQTIFKLLGKQINVIMAHKKEAIRFPKKWAVVFKITYLAYLLLYDISFKVCLLLPQGGKELPLPAFCYTIKYNLLQLLLHIFHGLASINNLLQTGTTRRQKTKGKGLRMCCNHGITTLPGRK